MRGLVGISCGPPAISTSRSDPKTTGMRLRITSADGTRQLDLSRAPGRRCGAGRVCGTVLLGHLAPAAVTPRGPSTGVGSVVVSVRALRHSE